MPKIAATSKELVARYIREFPNETFRSDSNILYCACCEKKVSTSQRFQVTQHIATAKHRENKERKLKLLQTFLTSSPEVQSSKSVFFTDLCRALVRADIPIYKVNDPEFKNFLEKYTGNQIPDESTLRKTYLKTIYLETLTKIREEIKTSKVWISIDETTDVEGRYIVNIIVGKMCPESPSTPFLLNCEVLEKCNHATIARFFNDSMSLLWPSGIIHENVLLFLTDAAPYMVKAGSVLKVFYPKMIHLTCVVHALHRVAETVRHQFPDVDTLISTVKKVFLKAPSRVKMFKDSYPELNLPPQPVITRWGTWLEAAKYYCENFEEIKDIILKLDSESSAALKKAKYLIHDSSLRHNLAFISVNAMFLVNAIAKLEAQNMPLAASVEVINSALAKLKDITGENIEKMKKKLQDSLEKNPDWKDMKMLANILSGGKDTSTLEVELNPMDMSAFKYAPISSVDVERSFSRYKSILRADRRHFLFENLKMHVVSNNFKL